MLHHTLILPQERRLLSWLWGLSAAWTPCVPGVARDWQLYTTQEVVHLRSVGVLRPSAAPSLSISMLPTLASLAQMQSAPASLWGYQRWILVVLGLSQIHPPRDRRIQVLQRVTSTRFQWPQGAAHHWKSPMSGTMMQTAKGMRKTENVIKITKGAGTMNAKQTMAVQSTGAHTTSASQVVTIAWLLSMANLMNLVIPQSITVQRSGDFTVKVHHMVMSIDAPAHTGTFTPSATSGISFNSSDCSTLCICQSQCSSPVIQSKSRVSSPCR